MQQNLAQEVRVIDNKGTINTIRNNQVTTATIAPTTPLEGDVWFDTSGTSTISKIFDDVDGWIIIDLDNVTTNATAPTTKNIGDVWFDTTTNTTKIYNGTTWDELGGTNTTFAVVGNNLQITDSKGTLSVPLSDLAHIGTEGSVFFAGTDGKPTENNSELFWDNTNNRLGVGTDNPTNKLEVSGATGTQGVLNSNGSVTEPSYRFKNDTDTGMFRTNLVDEMGFSAGGIEAMRIEEDANITLVTIKHNLALDGKLFDINDEAGTNGQILSSTTTGTDWVDASDFSWSINGNSGTDSATNFAGTIDSQDFVLKSNNIEKLRLFGTKGQVLINQASTYNDHALVIRANTNDLLAFQDNTGTSKWHWSLLDDGLSLNYIEPDTGLPDPPGFINTFDYRLYLEDDGNVGINTNDPTERLHVSGSLRVTEEFKDANNEAGTNGQVLSSTVTGTDWVDASSLETVTTITNTVTGHKIADYTNESGGTAVVINETVTSLTQDDTPTSTNASATGEITFSDENGNTTGKVQVVSANADNKIEVGNDGGAYLGPTVYTGFFIIEYNGGSSDATITLPFKPSQVTFVSHANVDSLNSKGDNASNNSNTIINSFGSMNGFANASTGTLVQQVIYVGGSGNSINDIGWFSSSSHVIGVRYGNQDGNNLGVIEGL